MAEDTSRLVLLVEDDTDIRTMVAALLQREGWTVAQAGDAVEMDRALADAQPDLVVLDINLPGEDGLSICRRLSAQTDISILMLTARSDDLDRIIGLEIGADDYLGKPFNPRELVARVRALLRRRGRQAAPTGLITVIGLTIDPGARTVLDEDRGPIKLSGAEFDLLWTLAEAPGRVLSRDFLLDRIHGRMAHPFDRSIDVLVSRLRKKIDRGGPSLIESVRNAGYVLRVSRT